jgi:hypothetical protein
MYCYKHIDVKSTLIGATVNKKRLPKDLYHKRKGAYMFYLF